MSTIRVSEHLFDALSKLVEREQLPLRVVSNGEADLLVVRSVGRTESDETTLQSGGWIACPTARAIAARLNINPKQMGKLLDVLDVKVRNCELGCF